MNKLSYGNYNSSNTDIAFSNESGYVDPANEAETRKQLSYPLKEIKDFVNKTVSVDTNDNAVQIIVSPNSIQYKTEPNGTPINVSTGGSSTPDTETIGNGDRLAFYDTSKSKLAKSSTTFGTDTTKFLRNDGTWESVSGSVLEITENTTFNISGTTFKINLVV